MIQQHTLVLPSFPAGFHLITRHVEAAIAHWPETGFLQVFLQHTSAGLTINENADPTVRSDFDAVFARLVPENQPYYQHVDEGLDDMPAHIKSSLVGVSLTVPITHGRLNLGTWQGIYLCEFRRAAGRRRLVLSVYS